MSIDEGQSCGVASFLECSICLHLFVDPKLLRCAHHFCRECVAAIAKQQDDGTTIIKCPMRCKEATILSKGQTVDEMSASYELKGILEKLQQKNVESEAKAAKVKNDIRLSMELALRKDDFKRTTEQSISLMESDLEQVLKGRKEKCIAQYSDFLNKQEQLLLYKLKTLCEAHLTQYDGLTSKKHKELLNKPDVVLLADQGEIDKIRKEMDKKTLSIAAMSISDGDFQSACPLGDLDLAETDDKFVVVEDAVASTLRSTFKIRHEVRGEDIVEDSSNKNDMRHRGLSLRSPSQVQGSMGRKRKRDDDLIDNPLCEVFDITQWVGNDNPLPSSCPVTQTLTETKDNEYSSSYSGEVRGLKETVPLKCLTPTEPFDITEFM